MNRKKNKYEKKEFTDSVFALLEVKEIENSIIDATNLASLVNQDHDYTKELSSPYYTDGVTDTANALGERFDEERLIKSFSNLCKQSFKSQEILNKIFKTLDEFTGKNRQLEDDASIVVFQLN